MTTHASEVNYWQLWLHLFILRAMTYQFSTYQNITLYWLAIYPHLKWEAILAVFWVYTGICSLHANAFLWAVGGSHGTRRKSMQTLNRKDPQGLEPAILFIFYLIYLNLASAKLALGISH